MKQMHNMEKLRKQCDATTQASNELIASLKKELAMQDTVTVQDARKLKNQMQTQEAETVQLRSSQCGDVCSSVSSAK